LFFQTLASYFGVLGSGSGPAWLSLAVDRPGAQGDAIQSSTAAPDLHTNYIPNENYDECEAGNEPFVEGTQVLRNPEGLQAAHTRETTPPPGALALGRRAGLVAEGVPNR
jgi:hypothetical protein